MLVTHPSELSDETIAEELRLIGERWKLLWGEQHNRKLRRIQNANVGMTQLIQQLSKPTLANNGSADFKRRL
jgi:hypothetical protein